MKTRVRVDRKKLADVVKGRLRKAEADYKRQSEAYPAKVATWNERQADKLDKLAAKARNGGLSEGGRIYLDDKPLKPSEGRELCNLRRMLKTLEIGTEASVLLSQEDADWYFGECKL